MVSETGNPFDGVGYSDNDDWSAGGTGVDHWYGDKYICLNK